ncbi:MAG: glutamate--cysteine ligase [Burkholderiaceae bacterium]
MSQTAKRLSALPASALASMSRGIEKESLRVLPEGDLSLRTHPAALGSAMTHPFITTDFSEAQLELVTGVHHSIDDCLGQLSDIHRVVYHHLDDELMWATSMPCRLPADDDIPIGQYGSSNIGRSKSVYRMGLAYRYGRRMQTVSGVHYNFSLPDEAWQLLYDADNADGELQNYIDSAYFSLIRNFKRHSWLLLYLFGASPAVCGTFVEGREHQLVPIGNGSMHLPFGTSMRMGPLGYTSDAQKNLTVSYNNLAGYADSLRRALTEPYPPYADIGIRDGDNYRQLNTTLLQIENEFYGSIRPKRRIRSGERPLAALHDRGVEYVEVRCLDIDPFSPIGVAPETAHFVDTFLLHCLFSDSPDDSTESLAIDAANSLAVAERGRQPDLHLTRDDGSTIALANWGTQLVNECRPIAVAMDKACGGKGYVSALDNALSSLADPRQTPSARVLSEMADHWDNSYQRFALNQSVQHKTLTASTGPDAALLERFDALARQSIQDQKDAEAADVLDFEAWRQQYIGQELYCS